MKKGKLVSKILGIRFIFVTVWLMLGKVANPTSVLFLFLAIVLALSLLLPGFLDGQAGLVSASSQVELVTNGGFEAGSTGWSVGGDFYTDSRFSHPHSGTGYAYLSNADGTYGNNLAGTLEQTVNIPSSATSAMFTFWYSITTYEVLSNPYDLCDVIIFDTDYNWLATAAMLDNTDSQSPISYSQVSLDLTDYAGQAVKIVVEATTDASYPTVFRLDDFSILATLNEAPECSVSAEPRSGQAPLDVTFTLSAEDSDGYIAAWVLDPDDGTSPYSGSGSPPPTLQHRYDNPSPPAGYTVILMVGDNDDETDWDTETVVVGENIPPECFLSGSPNSGTAPLTVEFTMTAADEDGWITTWVLDPDDGTSPYSGSGNPPSTLDHTYESEGQYTPILGVSDNKDATDFDSTSITVQPPQAPQVTAVDPAQPVVQPTRQPFSVLGSGFVEGAEVTLKAPDGELWVIPRPENPDINVSPTKIDVNAGFYIPGPWQVWVTNPDSQNSNVFDFNVDIEDRVDGIDVSHWQGEINWSQVRVAGYEFAFVKATEGVGWTDEKFSINMNGGHGAGVLVGAYHFARPDLGNSGAAEAEWFVSVARDYITEGYLRPVLDLERGDEMGWATLSNWVHDFMGTVKNQTGVEPILYTGWYKDYLDISVAQYDLWIAHWTYDPGLPPDIGIWDNWAFWQYSDQGTISGIVGDVDLDLFNGDMTGLDAFVISSPQPPQVTTHPATDVTATSAVLHGYLDSLGDYGPATSTREPAQFPSTDDYLIPVEAVVSVEITIGDRYVEYWEHVTDGGICVKNDYVLIHRDIDSNEIINYEKNWREVEFAGEGITPFEPPGGAYFWKELVAFLDSSDCGYFYTMSALPEYPLVCWEVRYADGTTRLYGLDGNEIGYGIPTPSKGFSLSGYNNSTLPDPWISWRLNADEWFQEWNSSTVSLSLPTLSIISSYVSDPDYRYYYAIAHGGPAGFQADSETSHYYASDAADDMQNRPPMIFAFIGQCEGMTNTGPGTFSYEFRKGSTVDTVTVGYSGMSGCPGWPNSLAWQDYMFQKMDEGYTMRDAFDLASAQYPLIADCVVFVGDPDLAVPSACVSFEWWTNPAHKNETFSRPMCTTGPFSEDVTGLTPGTTYYFQAKAVADGVTVYGDVLSFLTKPDAPISFSASAVSSTQIDLSWTKGDGAQKTLIQRKQGSYPTDRNDGTQVYFDIGTATSDIGLEPDATYYYRAWSYVSGSEEKWSDDYAEDFATTMSLVTIPTVITTAATLVEETTTTLNGAVSDDGGEACQYRFEYDTDSGEPYAYDTGWTGSKTTGQPFSESITGLSKGTKYYFRAQAKNSAGTANGSELTFLTKPDAPTSFSAATTGTTEVDLSWTKGDGAHKTKIQRKQGSYPTDRNDGTEVYFDTDTYTTDTGLTPGTTYYYRTWSYVEGSEQWSDTYAEDWTTTTAGVCGDVAPYPDCDGIVNMGDVVLLLNYVGHPGEYELCCEWCGDVAPCPASDGIINMGDVVLLLNYVGHPGEYQLCCE